MVLVVNSKDAGKVLKRLGKLKEKASLIGEVRKRKRQENQVIII
jgi:hydrogenase maturation factor